MYIVLHYLTAISAHQQLLLFSSLFLFFLFFSFFSLCVLNVLLSDGIAAHKQLFSSFVVAVVLWLFVFVVVLLLL